MNETVDLDDFDFDGCFEYVVEHLDQHEYVHDSIQNFIEANYRIEDARKLPNEIVIAIENTLDDVVSKYLGIPDEP